MSNKVSLEKAVELCKVFEKALRPVAHVALTGSSLYGENPNDVDIVVYPHQANAPDVKQCLSRLIKIKGFTLHRLVGPLSQNLDENYDDHKDLAKAYYKGIPVDVFFMSTLNGITKLKNKAGIEQKISEFEKEVLF